jgi:DMSO/TMAO reductase YedYZ molybdopterin-dependent catalytic subunit
MRPEVSIRSTILEPTRREMLRAGLVSALGLTGPIYATEQKLAVQEANPAGRLALLVRNSRPLDAETPVEAFDRYLTPNELFFVRSHFGPPAVGLRPWTLAVRGAGENPLLLSLEDLAKFEQVTRPAVLQCSGNGRAFYTPRIPGVGWERGAVGNAEWSGVRLKDVLQRAGFPRDAAHVHLLGADAPPSPKTPPFFRSIPLERALDPNTLIATRMNGELLPVLHGGPMRLVVPSWAGNHWIKWLRTITLSATEAPGFYMQTGYRMPKVPAPPGAELKPADLKPVTTLNVKSLIASPSRGASLRAGRIEARGVAWTGEGLITRVEVAVNGDSWKTATLEGPEIEGSWRLWRFACDARPGAFQIRVRATDSSGATQPDATPWNRSGYLWNGIDEVTGEVMA